MITTRTIELPAELMNDHRKTTRLEWITFSYTILVSIIMYFVMGQSQAMKMAWVEDVLSIVPSTSYLIANHFYQKPANRRFPYGLHSIFSSASVVGAVALSGIGLFIFFDSLVTLIKMERPTIGVIAVGGKNIWHGYLMILVLILSAIPIIILGRLKQPLAHKINNKILYTDAETQKADWVTSGAASIGIIGIGFGLWWADAVAALIISFDILKDGVGRLKDAYFDALSQIPRDLTNTDQENIIVRNLESYLAAHPWIAQAEFRLREEGQVYFGEVMFIPKDENDLPIKCRQLRDELYSLDWRIHDLVIMPTDRLN